VKKLYLSADLGIENQVPLPGEHCPLCRAVRLPILGLVPRSLPNLLPPVPLRQSEEAVSQAGGGGAPACCLSLEQVLAKCGFDIVDMMPVKRQNLEAKLKRLELAGRWLSTSSSTE